MILQEAVDNFFTLSFLQNLWYTVAEVIPMITISDLALQYSGTFLFQHVDLQFTAGNCYGVIGANGAGKSTFLKLLSGELDSTNGHDRPSSPACACPS